MRKYYRQYCYDLKNNEIYNVRFHTHLQIGRLSER